MMKRIIIAILMLSFPFIAFAQGERDLFKIKRMNTSEIVIGKNVKTVGSTFYLNEIINWSSDKQSLYVQNLRTKEYFILTKSAFDSKAVSTAEEYFITCKASTRGVSGKVRYGLNKEKYKGEKRIALLIGNSNYLYDPCLKNPVFDIEAVSLKLVEFGFDTYSYFDCGSKEMKNSITSFLNRTKDCTVALFYFAGHGITWENRNYYLPVNVELDTKESLAECIEGFELLNQLKADNHLTLILLDACRSRKRSWARGIDDDVKIQMEAPLNTAIVYSTTDGSFALDGDGELSPFAEGFIESLKKPDVSFSECAVDINKYIDEKTNHQQNSSQSVSLTEMFYFAHPNNTVIKRPAVVTPTPQQNYSSLQDQFARGKKLYDSGSYNEAFSVLKPLAEAGYVDAYFPVADMYHRGLGVKKDRNEAEKWYIKSSNAGNVQAKRILFERF